MSYSKPRYRFMWVTIAAAIAFCFFWSIAPERFVKQIPEVVTADIGDAKHTTVLLSRIDAARTDVVAQISDEGEINQPESVAATNDDLKLTSDNNATTSDAVLLIQDAVISKVDAIETKVATKASDKKASDKKTELHEKVSATVEEFVATEKKAVNEAISANDRIAARIAKMNEEAAAKIEPLKAVAVDRLAALPNTLADQVSDLAESTKAKVQQAKGEAANRIDSVTETVSSSVVKLKDEAMSEAARVKSKAVDKASQLKKLADKKRELAKAETKKISQKTQKKADDLAELAQASRTEAEAIVADTRDRIAKQAAKANEAIRSGKAKIASSAESAAEAIGAATTEITDIDSAKVVDVNAPPNPDDFSGPKTTNTVATSETKRPWLGLRLDQPKPRIDMVYPGSGAADTKIQPGDVIIGINDKKPLNTDDLVKIVAGMKASDTIKLIVMRGEEQLEFETYLGKTRAESSTIESAK